MPGKPAAQPNAARLGEHHTNPSDYVETPPNKTTHSFFNWHWPSILKSNQSYQLADNMAQLLDV